MAAAKGGGIPVSESVQNDLTSEFNWKGDVADFRSKWTSKIEAYDWALSNLMPGCNKRVVFALGIPLSLIDYVVASKGFVFGLEFNADRAAVEKIFRTQGYGVGTSLMGYANTGDEANAIANRYGIGYVVSDLYADGSFWSSFPNKTYYQPPGRDIVAQPGKIYASIMWSDGDNICFDQNPIWNFWHDPARTKVPVATQLSPTLQELNTPLLDWYYSRMTDNDEQVAGPTGVHFIVIRNFKADPHPAALPLHHTWSTPPPVHTPRNRLPHRPLP